MASYSYPFTQADGAPSGWTVHTGSASVVSNKLVLIADFTTDLATADDILTRDNYELEADITPGASYGAGQRIGLVMHYQNSGNYYYVWVKTGAFGGVYLYRYKAFTSTLLANDPSAGSRNIPPGTTLNLRIACSGLNGNPTFEVFLDDVSLFSHTDSANPISSTTGKIGVNQNSATGDNAAIDNVYVVEGNATPVVSITEASQTIMAEKDETTLPFTFNATANDEEDGDLTASIQWSLETDGGGPSVIGTGASVSYDLPIGVNVITAEATDSVPLTGSDSITITVLAYDFGGLTPVVGGFLEGDTYTGNGVRVLLTSPFTNGKGFITEDGKAVFFPDNASVTQTTFKYRIQDQEGISNEATITWNFTT